MSRVVDRKTRAVKQLKQMITTALVLKYFDPEATTILQCNTSYTGLGAVLLHDGHAIVYVSSTLSKTEREYAQIEKELAIMFSAEKFDQDRYERKVIRITNL